VLGPDAVADPVRFLGLAEKAVAAVSWWAYDDTLGATLYRAGQHAKAIQQLHAAMEDHPQGGTVFQWLFLSMAHHRQGQAAEAAKWLDMAVQWLDKSTPEAPKDSREHIPVSWDRWLQLQLLRHEAEALIRGTPAGSAPQARLAYARAHARLGQ